MGIKQLLPGRGNALSLSGLWGNLQTSMGGNEVTYQEDLKIRGMDRKKKN